MYELFTVEDKVRIPPKYFTLKLNEAVLHILLEKHEGCIDKDMGVIVSVDEAKILSEGVVIPGDGAAYYDVMFTVLCFKPEVNEVFEGDVTEVLDFGMLVRMGPVDGLVHLSQVTSDFMVYNRRIPALVGKDSNKTVKKGDTVYAKVSTVGMKSTLQNVKIGLTMRPTGLGKQEWVAGFEKAEAKAVEEPKKAKGKGGKEAGKKEEKKEKAPAKKK